MVGKRRDRSSYAIIELIHYTISPSSFRKPAGIHPAIIVFFYLVDIPGKANSRGDMDGGGREKGGWLLAAGWWLLL